MIITIPWLKKHLKTNAKEKEIIREDLDLHDQVKEATPLKRIGETSEAASAVLYLASPLSSFTTGQIITIDGGRTLTENIGVSAY